MIIRHLVVFFALMLAQWVWAAPLGQQDLERIAEKAGLPLWAFAVAMVPADGGEGDAYWHRADAPMNPASAMKLVTTYGALDLLGPHHQWGTSVYGQGQLSKNKRFEGDIYLQLTGDPKLTEERLWRLLKDVRNSGVNEITGDIVIDDSALRMPSNPIVFDDSSGRPYAPYLVGPSPVLLNYNLHHLQVRVLSGQAVATLAPHVPGVRLVNELQVSGSYCPPVDSLIRVNKANTEAGQSVLTLKGKVGAQCKYSRYLSLLPQHRYSQEVVAHLWQDMGGKLKGRVRFGGVPKQQVELLARSYSPDVASMVRDINKYSNNVMAQQLFLNIGAYHRTAKDEDDAAAARRTLTQWMREKGVNPEGLVLDNGSGLSRVERLTVRQTADLLAQAWQSPFAAEFIASMPLVALDGTLRRRMRNSGLEGEGHLKTGALANARALAGYIRDGDGKPWILVFYVNHSNAAKVLPALDNALVQWHRSTNSELALKQ